MPTCNYQDTRMLIVTTYAFLPVQLPDCISHVLMTSPRHLAHVLRSPPWSVARLRPSVEGRGRRPDVARRCRRSVTASWRASGGVCACARAVSSRPEGHRTARRTTRMGRGRTLETGRDHPAGRVAAHPAGRVAAHHRQENAPGQTQLIGWAAVFEQLPSKLTNRHGG